MIFYVTRFGNIICYRVFRNDDVKLINFSYIMSNLFKDFSDTIESYLTLFDKKIYFRNSFSLVLRIYSIILIYQLHHMSFNCNLIYRFQLTQTINIQILITSSPHIFVATSTQ